MRVGLGLVSVGIGVGGVRVVRRHGVCPPLQPFKAFGWGVSHSDSESLDCPNLALVSLARRRNVSHPSAYTLGYPKPSWVILVRRREVSHPGVCAFIYPKQPWGNLVCHKTDAFRRYSFIDADAQCGARCRWRGFAPYDKRAPRYPCSSLGYASSFALRLWFELFGGAEFARLRNPSRLGG